MQNLRKKSNKEKQKEWEEEEEEIANPHQQF
jgi:hypothetical protein